MQAQNLSTAVHTLAQNTHPFSDADLDQAWAWGPHAEGVRFALIGTYHELRDLAVVLAAKRSQQGQPLTMAQHALAQYHAAYRDLQALVLGVTDALYNTEPAPGEWPLRYVIAHIVGAERNFFTLVHYGKERQRDGVKRPSQLPADELERVMGPSADLVDIMENDGLSAIMTYYETIHERVLLEAADISDAELQGPSLWWEEIEFSLQHRLHRFDAHLRQHTLQAQKTLDALGYHATEARRLLRLVYNALAEVEGYLLGAPELDAAITPAIIAKIEERTADVTALVADTRAVATAVTQGDLALVKKLVAQRPSLINALDQQRLPIILTAAYHRHTAIVNFLQEKGVELSIFEAAAVGRLDVVQREAADDPEDVNAYGRDGFTPLQLASYFGFPHIVTWLIENGAAVNTVSRNPSKLTALHAATAANDIQSVNALLAAGANVNAQQNGGVTALHAAARNGNLEIVQILLDHKADAQIRTDDDKSALDFARDNNNSDIVTLLEG